MCVCVGLAQASTSKAGRRLQRLEYEISKKKQAFRMSLVALSAPPSILDGTAFDGEYSYGYNEHFWPRRRW